MLFIRACAFVALALSPVAAQAPDFAGRFVGAELSMDIERSAAGYGGTIVRGGDRFPFDAAVTAGELRGEFRSGGHGFAFTATVRGDELQLATGGASYVLRRTGRQAQPVPEPRRGPIVEYAPFSCRDVAGFREPNDQPMEVFRMLVPVGWNFEGGVTWNVQTTNPVYLTRTQLLVPAKIAFRVASPDRRQFLQVYPEEHFADLTQSPAGQLGQFPPWSNYAGAISHPVVDPATYIDGFVIPRQRGLQQGSYRVVESREIAELAQLFAREVEIVNRIGGVAGVANVQHRAALVAIEYEEGGARYRENFICDLMYLVMPGITMWSPRFSASGRAPAAEFAQAERSFLVMLASIRGNPVWTVNYLKVADQNWRGVQATDALIRQLDGEIARNRAQTNAEIHRQCYAHIGAWAEFEGPSGRRAYLSTDEPHQMHDDGRVRSGLELPRDEPGWHDMQPVVKSDYDHVLGR
ncbi:MAG: hypothetical protein IPM29_25040 [Planctomycetes bacterium]|nr:hypothetical protein [Planctomycetota bacterium]